jgi:hypothetical protein
VANHAAKGVGRLRRSFSVQNSAVLRRQNPGHDLEEGGFSRPVSTDKPHEFTLAQAQVKVMDARAGLSPEAPFSIWNKVAKGDAFELERHLHGPTSIRPCRPQA